MRMFFEPDEEGFPAFCEQLSERVGEWDRERGGDADPYVVGSALEYRHRGTLDGRLALWQERHVEEFLLEWLPQTLTELPGLPRNNGPEGLRALLRFLDLMGLADPRGDALGVLERAVDRAAGDFESAMADRGRWGMAKFWAMTAAEHGVDVLDGTALTRFTERAQRGEVPYDEGVLDAIMDRYQRTGPPQVGRAEPQLPVELPGVDVLRAAAEQAPLVRQMAGLARWAGELPQGRELTKLGRLRIADARELVRALDTGDRAGSPRTSAELPRLNLVFAWAKRARVVRVAKGRLHAVAKARPLLDDPLALWLRSFEVLPELREPLLGGPEDGWHPTSMMYDVFEDVLLDVLNTLYSLPYPMPWPRLRDSVHLAYRTRFDFTKAPVKVQRGWLLDADNDLHHVLDVLERLGAVRREQGIADPVYLELPDLDTSPAPMAGLPEGLPPELVQLLGGLPPAPDPEAAAQARLLREELASGPVELIRLTDLGTHAVRLRLLAEGRDAPLVGELTDAPAAGLLGVLAESYDPESARAELALWTNAHGGSGLASELLVQAVRETPFRARAEAMLDVLAAALPEPEGQHLLHRLRGERELAPTALSVLTRREFLAPDDLADAEALLMVAESLLQFLEGAGEEAMLEMLLTQGPKQAREAIGAALTSEHPDRAGLDRLRHLAEGPLLTRSAQPGRLGAARTRRGGAGSKRRKRR